MKDKAGIDTETGGPGDAENEAVPASPRRPVSVSRPYPLHLLRWLCHLSRFGLAGLFLFAAGAKLAIVNTFAANVAELLNAAGISRARWMWPSTIGVIVAEITAALLLLWPRTLRLGGLWSAALLIAFGGFALYYVYVMHGEPLECGCFGGIIASELGVKTALRNLALLVPATVVVLGRKHTYRRV